MQKALVIMNTRLPVVLSDIVGQNGQAIIKTILEGVRNSNKLAYLASTSLKGSKAEIAGVLKGHWQEQHLFELKQF
jgi:hypothetical protein